MGVNLCICVGLCVETGLCVTTGLLISSINSFPYFPCFVFILRCISVGDLRHS